MLQRLIAISILLILISACQEQNSQKSKPSLKDSVLNEYLQDKASLPYFDTSESNFRIMKAYNKNDTAFLSKVRDKLEEEKKYRPSLDSMESCLQQPKLQDLKVEEAYRFLYRSTGSSTNFHITISKFGEELKLRFITYKFQGYDTLGCRILEEYDKPISATMWTSVVNALDTADFWGLKENNGIEGYDGDNIKIIGYINKTQFFPGRHHLVYRWAVSRTTLSKAFELVMKYSTK